MSIICHTFPMDNSEFLRLRSNIKKTNKDFNWYLKLLY